MSPISFVTNTCPSERVSVKTAFFKPLAGTLIVASHLAYLFPSISFVVTNFLESMPSVPSLPLPGPYTTSVLTVFAPFETSPIFPYCFVSKPGVVNV